MGGDDVSNSERDSLNREWDIIDASAATAVTQQLDEVADLACAEERERWNVAKLTHMAAQSDFDANKITQEALDSAQKDIEATGAGYIQCKDAFFKVYGVLDDSTPPTRDLKASAKTHLETHGVPFPQVKWDSPPRTSIREQ